MKQKTRTWLILGITLALAGLVYAWFYPLNKGTLQITTGLNDYAIKVDAGDPISCADDPCLIKISAGSHEITFTKDKYSPSQVHATIQRFKTENIALEPKKIMELNPSKVVPNVEKKELSPPRKIKADQIVTSTWNTAGNRFFYLDKQDNRLKILDASGQEKWITVLQNLATPVTLNLSPDEKKLVAVNGKDLYLIGVDEGTRKKQTLDFAPVRLLFAGNDAFLMNDGKDTLIKESWTERQPKSLAMTLNLDQSVWVSPTTLLYFEVKKEGDQATIATYNVEIGARDELISKYDFPIDQVTYDAEKKTAYFHNPKDGGWFEMEM